MINRMDPKSYRSHIEMSSCEGTVYEYFIHSKHVREETMISNNNKGTNELLFYFNSFFFTVQMS